MSATSPGAQAVRDIIEASRYLVLATADLRLSRAVAESYWILARDGRPDHRIPVRLT